MESSLLEIIPEAAINHIYPPSHWDIKLSVYVGFECRKSSYRMGENNDKNQPRLDMFSWEMVETANDFTHKTAGLHAIIQKARM